MQLGVCTSVDNAAQIMAAGWDFVEENVQGVLQGLLPDAEWKQLPRLTSAPLPVRAANCLVPGNLKVTGPAVDMAQLQSYMTNVLHRAGQVGMKKLVFGSGGARQVPDGFDYQQARKQIAAFLRMAAPLAAANGVMIVVEPLHSPECNIVTTVAEGAEVVREVNHPSVRLLVDSFHFWMMNEPLENLHQAMPLIHHVHVADKVGRVSPGESGQADYVPFFKVLKQGGYDGDVSVEASGFDIPKLAVRVREYLQRAWAEA